MTFTPARALLVALSLSVLASAPVRPAAAQTATVRFEITAVGDSTVQFRVGKARWVRAGVQGMAVDPQRRDVLVARLRVLGVDGGVATALVTGQTTQVTTAHAVVLPPPAAGPWYRRATFWGGLAAGLVGGVLL